jgi:hypothetical protein
MTRQRLIDLCENMDKVEKQLDELEIELCIGHEAVGHAMATLQEVVLAFTAELIKKEGDV